MTRARSRPRHPARTGRPPRDERDRRLADRRSILLDAAIAAVEAEGASVTMTRMAAEAGVTKPVLYRYFGHRAGLYEAIAGRFADELRARLAAAIGAEAGPRAQLEAGIDAYLAHIEAHPGVYRFLTRRMPVERPESQLLVTGFIQRVAADVASALEARLGAAGLDPAGARLLGFGITGMVHLAGEAWLEERSMPREEAVRHLAGTLWRGLPPP